MTTEKIMDVVENNVETMAEPVVEAAKEIDWTKGGVIAGGAILVGVGLYGFYKLVAPKVTEGIESFKTNRNVRKQEKQDGDYIEVKKCKINDVEEADEQ
jgi:hypothetical protein